MTQIKTFQAGEDEEINKWLRDNPQIAILSIIRCPMFDRYSQGQGEICNQWVDVVVVYNVADD